MIKEINKDRKTKWMNEERIRKTLERNKYRITIKNILKNKQMKENIKKNVDECNNITILVIIGRKEEERK